MDLGKVAHSVFVQPIVSIWAPTRRSGSGASTPVAASVGIAVGMGTLASKFIGRTVTLGAGVAVAAVGLKALAGTSVGTALGATAFVATMSAFPPALLISAVVAGTIGAGLLSSYLIEKYSP